MTIRWGRDAKPSPADKPRKPWGSERPGHEHEGLLLTGMLIYIGVAAILGFASWDFKAQGDAVSALGSAGVLMFAAAVAMLVSLGLWLFLDLRSPLLLVGGASSITMIVVGLGSPLFLLLLPTALCALWAGLSALKRHRVDRWVAVAAAVVLSIVFGTLGELLFIPVALAAAFVPELEFGER